MKITHIDIYRLSIKMVPFAISTGIMEYAQNVFIRIHTNENLYGVGECSAFPIIVGETQDSCLLLAKSFAKIWKDKNPLAIEERLQELDNFIARNTTIKSAFDMALYDIASKHAKMPLYKFLGGEKKKITTDITVGIGTPEEMTEQAEQFANKGATYLKVKLGKIPSVDIKRIKMIRKGIGMDIPIRIDANQGWSIEDAHQVLNGIKDQNIQFCEQPLRTYDDYRVSELMKYKIPIMADESCYNAHDAKRLAREMACDYINIKLAKSGGISEALRIHKIAADNEISCMMGGMLESRLALTAMVHLTFACPQIKFFDLDTCLIGHLEDPVKDGLQFNGYEISVDDLPGIGADIDEKYLTNYDKTTV